MSHCSVLFCQPRTTEALLRDLRNTMVLPAPPSSLPLKNSLISIIELCNLFCIILTICWPSFQRVLSFSFLFFRLRKSSHIYKQWETHITRIFWTGSPVLSCPISSSSVKVEHAALQVARNINGCFICVCILKPFMLSWDIKEGFICLIKTVLWGQLQANIDPTYGEQHFRSNS